MDKSVPPLPVETTIRTPTESKMDSSFDPINFIACGEYTNELNTRLFPSPFSCDLSGFTNNPQQGVDSTANYFEGLGSGLEEFLEIPEDNLPQLQSTLEPVHSQLQPDTGLNFLSFIEGNLSQQQFTTEPTLPQSQADTGVDFLSFSEVSLSQHQPTVDPAMTQPQPDTIDPAWLMFTDQHEMNSFNFVETAPKTDLSNFQILQRSEHLESRRPELNLLLQPTFTRPEDMANVIPAFSFDQTAPIFGEFQMPGPHFEPISTMRVNETAHTNNSSNFRELTPDVGRSEMQAPPAPQSVGFNLLHRRPRNTPFSRRAPPEVAEEDLLDAIKAAPSQRDRNRVQQGRVVKKPMKRDVKRSAKKQVHWNTPLVAPSL